MTLFNARKLFLMVGFLLIFLEGESQTVGSGLEPPSDRTVYTEFGVNAFVLSRRFFNWSNYTSESTFVPVYGPGFFYKRGTGRRILRLSLNYIHFVSSVKSNGNPFGFNSGRVPPTIFSRQEGEFKVGIQRFSKRLSHVQRYVAHDFSYGYGIEKVDGFPAFNRYQFGTSIRQAFSISQIYGLRFYLSPDLVLNVETGFLWEVTTLKNFERSITNSSIKWRVLAISMGLKI